VRQPRDTAGAVPAHAGLGPVRVKKPHAEIAARGRLNQQEPFASNAGVPVAQAPDKRRIRARETRGTIIQKNEIVAGAVHFPEKVFHGKQA
jgi:hypothetical protein